MTTRREFLRRGALWVAAAAVVEPVARKLWAFPTNPLGRVDDGGYRMVWDDKTPPLLFAHEGEFLPIEEWHTRMLQYRADIVHLYVNGDSPIRNPRGLLS